MRLDTERKGKLVIIKCEDNILAKQIEEHIGMPHITTIQDDKIFLKFKKRSEALKVALSLKGIFKLNYKTIEKSYNKMMERAR